MSLRPSRPTPAGSRLSWTGVNLICMITVILLALFFLRLGKGHDFIEFWSALKLWRKDMNFYSPELILDIQRTVNPSRGVPMRLWHPPWLLLLLSPLSLLSFSPAVYLWFFLSVSFYLISSYVLIKTEAAKKDNPTVLIVLPFLFVPVLDDLILGQITSFLLLILTMAYVSINRGRYLIGGFLLSLLTIKIHLFFLLFVIGAYYVISEKKWNLLFGFIIGLTGLIALSELSCPGSLSWWLENLKAPPFQWVTATLTGLVRWILAISGWGFSTLPIILVPGLAMIFTTIWIITRHPKINLGYHGSIFLTLSILTSPYGWLFDQALLVFSLLVHGSKVNIDYRKKRFLPISVFTISILAFFQIALGFTPHFYFSWIPACVLMIILLQDKRKSCYLIRLVNFTYRF